LIDNLTKLVIVSHTVCVHVRGSKSLEVRGVPPQ